MEIVDVRPRRLLAPLRLPARASDDADDRPVLRLQLHALREQHLCAPAADRPEVDEAVVADVRDDHSDLVDVADDREQRPVACPRDARDR